MNDSATSPPPPSATPLVVPPGSVKPLRAFGDTIRVLLSGEQTGGRFAMLEESTDPGMGPPPHVHHKEDEWFYPLEGSAEFFLDGEWFAAEAGSAVYLPKGSVHTFRNAGDGPLRQLIHVSPSGFEVFFQRCAEVFAEASEAPPDMGRIMAIAQEHGIEFLEP